MEIFLLALRLVLAGVFGVAGVAKAFDPAGSLKAFDGFGIPRSLGKVLVYALPAFEIAVAISLFFTNTSWYGALGALTLLLLFTGGMLYQLAKGNAPDCHCFGQLHSEPVGISSIVRNILLLIPAGILAVQGYGAQGMPIATTRPEMLTLLTGLLIAALTLIAILYIKQQSVLQRQVLRRLEIIELMSGEARPAEVEREAIGHPRDGLPFGALVPDFTLPDIDGNQVTLADIRSQGLPVLFLSVKPDCIPCKILTPEINKWEEEFKGKIKFVFLSSGTAKENRKKFGDVEGRTILLQEDREVALQLKLQWTPMAVLMNRRGRIASFSGASDLGLHELTEKLREGDPGDNYAYFPAKDQHKLARIRIGEEVRHFSTTDIYGKQFTSDDLRGRQTLIYFSSPGCKYCGAVMEDMKAWDATKNGVDPALVVFTDGDPNEHKKIGLNSPIIIDERMEIGISIGQLGMPSAIMYDEHGRIISETAVGGEDIWALVGRTPSTSTTDG